MKKKTKLLSLISTSLIGLALSLGVSGVSYKGTSEVDALYNPSTTYNVSDTASELATYYNSINNQTGDSLLSALRSINSSKYHKNFSYSNFGTSSSTSPYVYTDYPIGTTSKDSNGQIRGSSIASFYTKTTADSFNKEHVWPNSKGGNKVENDILMPRPTISSENSSRGNSNFVEGMNSSSGGWDPYTAGYDKECRGECARIMLYCVVASSQLSLVASNSGDSTSCGNMNTLIKWHFDYAPSEYEMNRNNGSEYLQGNRNPFVDHPEYVARIWSNFNSTVSNLCTQNEAKYTNWTPGSYCKYGENTPVNTNGVTISKNSETLTVGDSTTISATSTNSSTISWTTSNSSVVGLSSSSSASGSNITLTANGSGTATITAKATISGTQYSATCTVTVNKVVSSLSKGSTNPTKTSYTAGEHFDPTGLTITAIYSDSTQGNVTSSVVWSPDPLTAGTTSVTGTYGGKSIVISGITVEQPTEPVLVTSTSSLSNGDSVILRTNEATPKGVTGYNGSKDATVSTTESQWKKFTVGSASSSGWTLYDSSATQYIASPGGNEFKYSSTGGTCSVDSDGRLLCSNRYLCVNGTNYRFYTSYGSYPPFYVYKVPGSSSTKTLSSISVSTAPTKVTYTAGETFDPTGLVITRTYSDSTSDTYTYAGHTSEFTFSPTTSTALTTSNVSVTITYGGKSCSQAITVNAAKTLSSISVSTAPTKTTYTAGENFDPTGLVIRRNYSDSTYDTYTYSGHTSEFTFSPSTSTALTTSNVSVTITYGGKSTSQAITVNAAVKTLSSISISGQKTSFTLDESFSFGGTVTAHFSDSSTSNVTSSATFSGYNMSVAGNYTVTVSYTYSGTTKTTTYSITVTASGGSGGGESEEFTGTYNYSNKGTTWSLSDCSDGSNYWLCPASGTESVALIEGIFTDKIITSDVVITINSATYGSGGTPTSTTYAVYNSSACTSQVSATQTGTLPSSSTYTNVIYTVASASTSSFSDDLAIKITKPGRQIRLKSITVEFEYEVPGSGDPITSITATPNKTFYVGETITASDITVKGQSNQNVTDFSFTPHTFTYAEAASGGALTNVLLSVSYEALNANFSAQVQRKAYAAPTGTSSLEHTGSEFSTAGIGSSYTENQTATVDGVTFSVDGYIYNSKLSLSSSKTSAPGKVVNTTPYPSGISNVTVSGASPDIQLSTDGLNWVDLSSSQTSTTNYYYLKLFYKTTSQSNYVNITSFTVTMKPFETPENVANYIMYEDTDNQCVSKLPIALGYYKNLSSSEKTTFQTSENYVISTARNRLNAWAASQGKTINYSTGELNSNAKVFGVLGDANDGTLLILIVSMVSVGSLSILLIIKKKRLQ